MWNGLDAISSIPRIDEVNLPPGLDKILCAASGVRDFSVDNGCLDEQGEPEGSPYCCFAGARFVLDPADEQFALVDHFRRQVIVEFDEQLFVAQNLLLPSGGIELLQFVELVL